MDVTTTTTAPTANATTRGIFINNQQQPLQGHGSNQGATNIARLRRESIAHSQGMGGVSWGSLTIGSWLRDEVMIHAHMNTSNNSNSSNNLNNSCSSSNNVINLGNASSFSPPGASSAYLPNLEKQYCKDYSCCGLLLPGLHDLLRHYEEAHIATSPGAINTHATNTASNPGMTNLVAASNNVASSGNLQNVSALQQQKRRMAAMYQQQVQHQQLQQLQQQQQQQQQVHQLSLIHI